MKWLRGLFRVQWTKRTRVIVILVNIACLAAIVGLLVWSPQPVSGNEVPTTSVPTQTSQNTPVPTRTPRATWTPIPSHTPTQVLSPSNMPRRKMRLMKEGEVFAGRWIHHKSEGGFYERCPTYKELDENIFRGLSIESIFEASLVKGVPLPSAEEYPYLRELTRMNGDVLNIVEFWEDFQDNSDSIRHASAQGVWKGMVEGGFTCEVTD